MKYKKYKKYSLFRVGNNGFELRRNYDDGRLYKTIFSIYCFLGEWYINILGRKI